MALVNPIVYRLPFRRNWIYRDNLFFAPSLYSSVTGGAYFLPYIFKRLFEQRQFRDIETYFSHFLVKRFNNNILYYQFFYKVDFLIRLERHFRKNFFRICFVISAYREVAAVFLGIISYFRFYVKNIKKLKD